MPTNFRSNFPDIVKAIRGIKASFAFSAKGRYKRLGTDILDSVAQAIYDETVLEQKEPGGAPLAPLRASTLRRKARLGQPSTIGVATGRMLAMQQLQGRRQISGTTASMTYGTTEEERQKAEWFQAGSKKQKRRKRPFYDLNRRTERDIDGIIEDVIGDVIRRLGG